MENLLHFSEQQLYIIEEAIDISEDLVLDYFNISSDKWKDYRYEYRTLAYLSQAEKTDKAFAQVCKYECIKKNDLNPPLSFDLYRICIQDNWILNAIKRSLNRIGLRPLILYIATHELTHVMRFIKHYKDFFASPEEKELEEAIVHSVTYEMLKSIGDRDLDCVLHRYRDYRWE